MTKNIRQALGLLAIAAAALLAASGMDPTPGDLIHALGVVLGVISFIWIAVDLLKPQRDRVSVD